MTTGQPKRNNRNSGRRQKEQVFDVVNAANTYCTRRRSIYTSLGIGAPRRRDPLCPFRSFCGVVVVVASPCVWQGKTVEEPAVDGWEGVCVGWMGHGTRAGLGMRISTVAGLAAIVPVNHPPAWRVLWLQWKRDLVWLGDGGGRWLFRMDRRRPGWDVF